LVISRKCIISEWIDYELIFVSCWRYTLLRTIIGSQQNGIEYLYEALDFAAKGKVKVMAKTFPLEDISQAYDRVANGQVRFLAIIRN